MTTTTSKRRPRLPKGLKYNWLYRINLTASQLDEYPELARYEGNLVASINLYDRHDRRYLMECGGIMFFCSRNEIGEPVGKDHKPAKIQRALLRAASKGARYHDLDEAYSEARGWRADPMALSKAIAQLLDKPIGGGKTSGKQRRTIKFVKRLNPEYRYTVDEAYCGYNRHMEPYVYVERPFLMYGYMTRRKVDGTYLYTLTEAGRAALGSSRS